jgi:ribosomal protein L37AE/L43A
MYYIQTGLSTFFRSDTMLEIDAHSKWKTTSVKKQKRPVKACSSCRDKEGRRQVAGTHECSGNTYTKRRGTQLRQAKMSSKAPIANVANSIL